MANNVPNFFQGLQEIGKSLKRFIPIKVGNDAERHFKLSFVNGGFTDSGLSKWPKGKKKGGSTLVKSGNLKASVRVARADATEVRLTAGNQQVNYAEIHNEGGVINKIVTVKEHKRRRKGRSETVKSHSRKMNLVIKQRQFMGNSEKLNISIGKTIDAEIARVENIIFK